MLGGRGRGRGGGGASVSASGTNMNKFVSSSAVCGGGNRGMSLLFVVAFCHGHAALLVAERVCVWYARHRHFARVVFFPGL